MCVDQCMVTSVYAGWWAGTDVDELKSFIGEGPRPILSLQVNTSACSCVQLYITERRFLA